MAARSRWAPSLGGQRAQALDRAGEGELGAAEALDEVAAAGGAEQLEVAELRVEGREAARHALGEDGLAGDDPVALQHQLRLGAEAGAGGGGVGEERRGQRPAALDRGAGGRSGGGRSGGPGAPAARRRAAAAPAAARRRRWSPRPTRRGPRGRCAAPRRAKSRSASEVEPEVRAGGEALADRVVDLALGRAPAWRWPAAGRRGGRPRGSRGRRGRRCGRAGRRRSRPPRRWCTARRARPGE